MFYWKDDSVHKLSQGLLCSYSGMCPVDYVLNTHSPACGSIWKDVELLGGKDRLQKIDQ